jgi:subtilisin family serine protease
MKIKKAVFLLLTLTLLSMLMLTWYVPAGAESKFQLTPFPTPTPGTDGRILYIVQSGDTLWRIAGVADVSLDQLRSLNNLEPDQVIFEGQVLLLGLGGPSDQPTSAPISTAVSAEPTPTEVGIFEQDTVTVCVLLYNDINGDAFRQEEEVAIEGGEVSVTERTGLFSDSRPTIVDIESSPVCFEELPEGNYTVSVAAPAGYNNTTVQSVTFDLVDGETSLLNFGAQTSTQAAVATPIIGEADESGRSPLLGIIGVAVLLGGLVLGYYSSRLGRQSTK